MKYSSRSLTSTGGPPSWFPTLSYERVPSLATAAALDDKSRLLSLFDKAGLNSSEPVSIEQPGEKERLPEAVSQTLVVRGSLVDAVDTTSRPIEKLVYPNEQVSDAPSVAIQTIMYWAPAWQALDPAYLRLDGKTDLRTLFRELAEDLEQRADLGLPSKWTAPKVEEASS